MDKLKMGVLGCSGHYAKRIAVPILESLLVEPYAIASRDLKKSQDFAKKWGFSKAYGSYEELLADPEVDFIYNPLPNHLHLEWIKKAADAGKPMLCEKPLTLNAQEARLAARYCAERQVPLMEAFMYRFHPQWQRTRDLIRSGEIGRLMTTHCVLSYNNGTPAISGTLPSMAAELCSISAVMPYPRHALLWNKNLNGCSAWFKKIRTLKPMFWFQVFSISGMADGRPSQSEPSSFLPSVSKPLVPEAF